MNEHDVFYNMKLHENINTNSFLITRVPGGWIYQFFGDSDSGFNVSSVFVPFNNEFQCTTK